MNRKTFYGERDSRTLELVDTDYRSKKVLITIDDDTFCTVDGQVMLFTALNLISRFCCNIDVHCNPLTKTHYLPPKYYNKNFSIAMLKALGKIDPFGKFDIVAHYNESYNAVLSIGNPGHSSNISVTIYSDGWLAYVGRGRRRFRKHRHEQNPIGAGTAACFGASEIFKNLIPRNNFSEYIESACFSALDYSLDKQNPENPLIPKEIKLGKIQIIGVGAVGSAVLAFLDLLPIQGEINLIDFDRIEFSNLNRYLIATINDVGRSKVDVGREYLSNHNYTHVNAFRGKYEEYVNKVGRGEMDVVLPLVDNNAARHQAQMNMPPIAIYGTTGSWAMTVARHKALEDDCIICRYPKKEEEELPCGTVEITQPETNRKVKPQINAAVSFVSALAGILVAGELVKRNYGRNFTNNFFQIDMAATPYHMQHFQRHPVEGCICQMPWFRRVYEGILATEPRKKPN